MRIASRVPATSTPASAGAPAVVWLRDPAAVDADLVGAKAANLARAAGAGLPVLPGFAVTTAVTTGGQLDPSVEPALREAWSALQQEAPGPLAVRSSSTAEDTGTASMAGQFTSVLDVTGWDDFRQAVDAVLASAARPKDGSAGGRPMAVLVQPMLDAACGGVLFGLDPVSGDVDHVVVEAVPGTPDALVSGRATAVHATLSRRGRLLGAGGRDAEPLLTRQRRRRLARLAKRSRTAFGAPQDVEWAIDAREQLWLLQSRAVTATGDLTVSGPVLGPGPVAETFPDALRPLEEDLWVTPLRDGVAGALRALGAVAPRRIEESPVVCTVGSRVAADLELFGIVPHGSRARRLLDPARGGRRLLAAWRTGRLRAALPELAADLVDRVDADLAAVDDLRLLDDQALLVLLAQARQELVALHGHEVLAGMLLRAGADGDRPSAAAAALAAVARGRAMGREDAAILSCEPVTLELLPPAIGGSGSGLPSTTLGPAAAGGARLGELGPRDALRLRCRWVQELTARAAEELGRRLAARGALPLAADVRELRWDELRCVTAGAPAPDLAVRRAERPGPPLPVTFRLSADAQPVATDRPHREAAEGLAASAGRVTGAVCHDPARLPLDGSSVLVVDTLDPHLAGVLGHTGAIVSETGSALSHLAILARELHVPAVVAVPDARRRFPEGRRVLVDGGTGEVRLLPEEAGP